MASILFQPWSGMTSGRYVAEKVCLEVTRVVGRYDEDESGEGVPDEGAGSKDGCGNVI